MWGWLMWKLFGRNRAFSIWLYSEDGVFVPAWTKGEEEAFKRSLDLNTFIADTNAAILCIGALYAALLNLKGQCNGRYI